MEESEKRTISFSPPDIGEEEIAAVGDVLRSGWITTGPQTKRFERELAAFIGTERVACLSSATAAAECVLRALGIGPGDEVITSAYTYTASASPICHVGATPVLCDVAPDSFEMNYAALPELITERTKAIIPVDLGGIMCDYDALYAALRTAAHKWRPAAGMQSLFDRVIVIADAAHALGASYKGAPCGTVADFTTYSFHAVKNITTAEGGALTWRSGIGAHPAPTPGDSPSANAAVECPLAEAGGCFDSELFYHHIMLLSLHGQSKDALAKDKLGSWEYDIAFPGWKCNMTDIMAAIGLVQLKRYPDMVARRREMIARYEAGLADLPVQTAPHFVEGRTSSGHLMFVRLQGKSVAFRNALVERMAAEGVATNVHYKPLPLLTAYSTMGFEAADFPHAVAQYENEITLPLHTLLTNDDIDYVVDALHAAYRALENEGAMPEGAGLVSRAGGSTSEGGATREGDTAPADGDSVLESGDSAPKGVNSAPEGGAALADGDSAPKNEGAA